MTEPVKVAKYIKRSDDVFDGSLYRFDPPLVSYDGGKKYRYAVASASSLAFEVLVFPSNRSGKITSFGEIAGERGTLDIDAVVRSLGYEVE